MRGRKSDQPFIDQVADGPMDFETLDHLQWDFANAVEAFNTVVVEKYIQRFADVSFIAAKCTPRKLLEKMDEDKKTPWENKIQTFELFLKMASSSAESFKHINLQKAMSYLIASKKMPAWVRQDLFGMLLNLELTPVNSAAFKAKSGVKVTPLIYAVMKGNLLAVEALLMRDDLDMNFVPEDGEPALIVALKHDGIPEDIRKDIVAALMVDERTDPNILSKHGETALHIAVMCHDAEMARILNRVDVNAVGRYGTAALHYAVMLRKVEHVKACLEREDLELNHPHGALKQTALDFALHYVDNPIVALLLGHPKVSVALKNEYGRNALHSAIMHDFSLEVCQAILNKEAVVSAPLSEKGKEEQDVAPKLITEKISILDQDGSGNTPLVLAAKLRRKAVAEWLLSLQNNDVNVRGSEERNALHYFAANGDEDLVAAFLKHNEVGEGAINAVDANGYHALHFAAKCGHTAVVKQLLGSGRVLTGAFGVDKLCANGDTPLMLAAEFGDVAMVKALVAAGADLMQENSKKEKPNEIALRCGKPEVCSALIEAQIQQDKLGNISAISMFQPAISASAKQQEQQQKTAPRGPH